MPEPPKAESEIVDEVHNRVKDLGRRYEALHNRWINDIAYFYNRPRTLLKNQRQSLLDPNNRLPVFNKLHGEVELHTSNMIGSRPEIFVRAFGEQNDTFAQRCSDAIHNLWNNGGGRPVFRRVCRTASMMGTGLLYIGWEHKNGIGKPGNVCFKSVNPFELYVDPDASEFLQARWIIINRYVTRQEAARSFPLMKDNIVKMEAVKLEKGDTREQIRELAGMPWADDAMVQVAKDEDSDLLQYTEMWQDGGGSVVKILANRLVTQELATTGKEHKTITYPAASPFAHGVFPIVPFYANEDPFGPWGISDIYNVRDTQDHHNKAMQQFIMTMDALMNIVTKLYVSPDLSGNETIRAQLESAEFRVIPIESLEQIPKMAEAATLVQVANLLLQEAGAMEQEEQEISGVSDAMKGLSMPRVYSGRHQAQLSAASERLFGPRLDALVTSMTHAGKMLLSLIEQFYTDDLNSREFRVRVGEVSRSFRTHDEDGEPLLPRLEEPEARTLEDSRFEIYVQPQDEYPMSRQQQSQTLLTALQYGGANVESVMRTARTPNTETMLAKMGEQLVGGLDPMQPWPEDVVARRAMIGRMAMDLEAMGQQVEMQQLQLNAIEQQMRLEGIAQSVLQGQPQMGQPQGQYAEPMMAIPTAGPGMPQGMPPEMAQMQAEMGQQNIGQPPVEGAY